MGQNNDKGKEINSLTLVVTWVLSKLFEDEV